MAVLEGSEQLKAALQALPANIQTKVLRKSAIAGARIVRDQVKVFAPVASAPVKRRGGAYTAPGTLKKAVVLKFAREKSSATAATYVVAVRHGKRQQKTGRDAFYYLWVEQGHAIVTRSGKKAGQVPPHPFFVPAYRSTAGAARDAMKSAMEKAMTDLINQKG